MTKKGGSKHLKRLPAPASWSIHRKAFKWVVKPSAGPYAMNKSLPLLLVVRELLGLVKNRREAKRVLVEGIKVDGKVRRQDDYPIGIMDVVEIPSIHQTYRVLPSHSGLRLHAIEGDETMYKLCKVVGKSILKGGHTQLHVHDGKNVLIKAIESEDSSGDLYETHDLVKLAIPDYDVLDHLKFEEGILGIVHSGKNTGAVVEVKRIVKNPWPSKTLVTLLDAQGNQFETILDYIFPIGKDEPWITLPE